MDANGTRFHLLLGRSDWSRCTDGTGHSIVECLNTSPPQEIDALLCWNEAQQEITLQPQLFRFTAAPKDRPPVLQNRRGADRDRFGNWYWIAENQSEILVNSVGTGKTSHFWSASDGLGCAIEPEFGSFKPIEPEQPRSALQLSGLAITEDHYLVVGVLAPAGLIIFDLHAGGSPQQKNWPANVNFVPFDMSPRPGGGVWILDKDHKCYWALDRHFQVISKDQHLITLEAEHMEDFQPANASSERRTSGRKFPAGISLEHASLVAAIDPIAIEALPDGTVLILDQNLGQAFSQVYHYNFAESLGQPVSTDEVLDMVKEPAQSGFRLIGHDFAFVPEHQTPEGEMVKDRLYIVALDGNQAFAFDICQVHEQLALEPVAEYYPMRLFGGKGLVADENSVYYDFADRWIPLVQQARPRYVTDAMLDSPVFDGHAPDCVWHRLMLDACLPPETNIQVFSRAANDRNELKIADWQPEPALYRRGDGSELPFAPVEKRKHYGTFELLFQQARGRYLQLRLKLSGNGRNTPRIQALRAYYPRFSYLERYLPAVYREESSSASFLDRFLANLEGFYTAIEDKIAAVQMLFDLRSAPAEVLEWLASWFGMVLDPGWEASRRRLFLQNIMTFFQYRGTVRGLKMALHLALDSCVDESLFTEIGSSNARAESIRIIEKYRTRRMSAVALGDPTELSGIREITPVEGRWQPSQGAEMLHDRYIKFLSSSKIMAEGVIQFPVQEPTDPALAALWRQFVRENLGFIPSASGFKDLWQDFLQRRYQHISVLNNAYLPKSYASFEAIELQELPADGAPLLDWYQFETIVLPMHKTAHRFSVLLPVSQQIAAGTETYRQRLELATRVVSLEKPAHTIFDIKFFWALFQVGSARLGEDTALGQGSRAPELLPAMILGQNYLAESILTAGHPQNVQDRQILGRDPLKVMEN